MRNLAKKLKRAMDEINLGFQKVEENLKVANNQHVSRPLTIEFMFTTPIAFPVLIMTLKL